VANAHLGGDGDGLAGVRGEERAVLELLEKE
jgi:hypothetical protein